MQTRFGKKRQLVPVSSEFRKLCICGALCMGLAAFAFPQEAQISFTEGGEFALTSGGERMVYRGGRMDSGGLSMYREDILQTGQGSFVELRLEPGGTRIKVAENTSLIYSGAGPENGSLLFTLLYGRIRLSTSGGWPEGGENPVYIKTGQAAALFRMGDAGVDYIARAAKAALTRGEPVLRIYCFSGNPELIPAPRIDLSQNNPAPRFQVHEYESLSIEVMNPLSYIERRPLEESIINYWNLHNFSGGMPALAARSAGTAPAPAALPLAPKAPGGSPAPGQQTPRVVEKIQLVQTDNSRNKKLNSIKNALLITGTTFTIGGLVMQGAGMFQPGGTGDQHKNTLINYGYLPLGLGILLNVAALIVNPSYPDTNAAD